jgi:AraC-like DNA-binding protein
LRLNGGGRGHFLGMSHEILVDGFGTRAESVNLRHMVDKTFTMTLDGRPQEMAALQGSFDRIDREVRAGDRASWIVMTAHLSLILVEVWRLSGAGDMAMQSEGTASAILQRFRQLVEIHFREHWMVADYAAEMGVSRDHLHDICKRNLARTPLQLIHERLTHESQLLLERSTLTIQQIAASLGFKDVSHFSHFFKRRTSLAPNQYRLMKTRAVAVERELPEATFADWP